MFGSIVIDVVIAMALVFFVFSLVTSGLREVVAWLLNTRSKVLWRSVRDLLDDPISYGIQPLYEAIAAQPGKAAGENMPRMDTAERALRMSRNKEETSQDWTDAVNATMSKLRSELTDSVGLAGALSKADERLKKAYAKPNPVLATAGMFWRREAGGRPRSPVVPTIGSVTAIAQSVHDGVRSFTDAVYEHPLVRQVDKTVPGKKSKLTWLDSGDFSGAALDLIQAAGIDRLIEDAWADATAAVTEAVQDTDVDLTAVLRASLHGVQGRIAAGTADAGVVNSAFRRLTSELVEVADREEAQEAIEGALEGLRTRLVEIAETGDPLSLLEQGLDALESIGPVRDTVSRATAAARHAHTDAVEQLAAVSASVGAWYDGRMESLTVWYRKRSRFVGFALAFIVVLGFNVDAVDIPLELWQNETVRAGLVAVAESSELDLAACVQDGGGDEEAGEECVQRVEGVVNELLDTGLPLGWVIANKCNGECTFPVETLWYASGAGDNWWDGPLKIVGWMLGAAALSMGASFWYDIMRRAMGIKSAAKGDQKDS